MCSNISSLTVVIFLQAEEHLTKATEEYEHYNELVKKELPIFFEYRAHFIEPVVSNFYHLQVKIYRILYEKMERLISDTGYFDVQSDIVEHYKERKVEVNQQIETHLTLFKNKKKSKKESKKSLIRSIFIIVIILCVHLFFLIYIILGHHDNDSDELTDSKHSNTNNHGSEEDAPPPYSSTTGRSSASISSSNPKLYPVQKKAPPPLPPHNSKPKSVQYVRALYDYEAQAEGDLSFKKGDKIEVITRKEDVNEWWKGKLNGKIGDFPGNILI